MKNKKPSLLYRLFDSNVYGKFSQLAFFFGGISLVAGQFLPGSILLGVGAVSLGTSICKNIIDSRRKNNYIEVPYEEYIPENTRNSEHTQSRTYQNYRRSSRENSNEREL